MIEQKEFYELIKNIVETELPIQKSDFDFFGEDYITEVYETGTIKTKKVNSSGGFEFGLAEAKVIAEIISVIISSYNIIKTWFEKEDVDIRESWKKELIKAGIKEEKAILITNKFNSQVNRMVKKARLKNA